MSGFTLPTSRPITQVYGAEFDDWDGDGVVDYPGGFYHSIGWNGHNGIDYGCFTGDPIEAVADGVVTFAGWSGDHWLLSGGGNAILVEHPAYGVQTEYLHLSAVNVSVGQAVKKGQVIARSGATGAATAAHLHLGMLPIAGINVNNRMRGRIDPTPYLYGNLNPDYSAAAAIAPQSSTPVQEDTLSAAEVKEIKDHINAVLIGGYSWKDGKHYGIAPILEQVQRQVAGTPAAVWATPVKRSGGSVSALQELADAKSKLLGIEPVIAQIQDQTDPAVLADLIPDAIAQQLIDALAARLNGAAA